MKKLCAILLLSLIATISWAYDVVKVGGINYDLEEEEKTAEVESITSEYTGAITIPSTITVQGVKYSVTSIGDEAFEDYSGLTSITIPNSVKSIEWDAFQDCSSLTSITIPNSVTSIKPGAFDGCTSLTSISVEPGNKYFDSRNNCNAIISKKDNTLIAGCKNTTIPNSVTSIGEYAFQDCSSLTSITIPNSVKSIGDSAFRFCDDLTSITIPNSVKSIGGSAFRGCTSLTSITIGNSVEDIQESSFSDCDNLKTVICKSTNVPEVYEDDIRYLEESANEVVEYNDFRSIMSNATLYVPKVAIGKYKRTDPWDGFGAIKAIEQRLHSNKANMPTKKLRRRK